MIKRKISNEIKTLAKEFPIVAILGPRQSGKTTIARHLFKNYDYVSMEDYDVREMAIDDPRGFLNQYPKNVIIDEIQRVPQLFSYLQTHVDKINKKGSFILTGSQNYLLMENISQSLAGRVGLATLLPLSLEEYPGLMKSDYKKVIFDGFYPRIFDQKIRPSSFYKTYLATYLEKDIRLIKNILNYNDFVKFLGLIAGRSGQILNIRKISSDAGIDARTVKNWLNVLETSYIVFRLHPLSKNYNKRIIKRPKIFFYDTGLLCHLLGINKSEELTNHYYRGNIFENFVISDIFKNNLNRGGFLNFYFWKDSNDNEIDLLIESGNKLTAIEIKSAQTVKKEFLKNLLFFDCLEQEREKNLFLFYGGEVDFSNKGIDIFGWRNLAKGILEKMG